MNKSDAREREVLDAVAERLGRAGWIDRHDAQWAGLALALPDLAAILAPAAQAPDGLTEEVERLRCISWLIGNIFAYGGFKAETHNERVLEKLLRAQGTFWTTPAAFEADLLAAPRQPGEMGAGVQCDGTVGACSNECSEPCAPASALTEAQQGFADDSRRIDHRPASAQQDERLSLRTVANLAYNALHECKPLKGAEQQVSDAIQALHEALKDIAYSTSLTATPKQFADHLQRTAREALNAVGEAQKVSEEIICAIQRYGDARADNGDSAAAIGDVIRLLRRPQQVRPAQDEREAFEAKFPMPPDCIRCGDGYAATSYSAWQANDHIQRWKGWQARAVADARGEVVVTWDEARTRILAVTRQNDEGQILSTIAEAPGNQAQADAGAVPAGLLDALRFYANGSHFTMHDSSAWDTVSGEPPNFYEDESNTATVEDGSVAKLALQGKFFTDQEYTEPPVEGEVFGARPSPAAESDKMVLVPRVMTAAMINAWSGGTTVTSGEVAARTHFQDAWGRVLRAAMSREQSGGGE